MILWLGLSVAVSILARQRGRSRWLWLILAMVLSPVVAGLVLLMKADLAEKDFVETVSQDLELTHVRCPHCAEYVRPEANECKFCHHKLTPQPGLARERIEKRLEAGLEDLHTSQYNIIIMSGVAIGFAVLIWLVWALF